MCIYRIAGMALLQSGSSSDYCETTAVSLGKSLLTSFEVMVWRIGN
jgi:hypothetical protein